MALILQSDNSKSISSGEPVLKKHKLVSSLISPENDETSGTPRPNHNSFNRVLTVATYIMLLVISLIIHSAILFK